MSVGAKRRVALVTGASAGLGAAYCDELARRGYDVVLVARDAQRLQELGERLVRDYRVAVEVLAADLADPSSCARVERRLADPDRPIDLLVNNAGFTTNQSFVGGNLVAEQAMLDVLVRAVLRLTHAGLPPMVARGSGAVVVVSSVAAWIPGGTYSAAKAWTSAFCASLQTELVGTGVRVLAVHPGLIRTEFHSRAGIDTAPLPGLLWLSAPAVVGASLDDLARGRSTSTPSRRYRVLGLLARHAPAGLVRRSLAVGGHRSQR